MSYYSQPSDVLISPSPAIEGKILEGSIFWLLFGRSVARLSCWQGRDDQVIQSLPDQTRPDFYTVDSTQYIIDRRQ